MGWGNYLLRPYFQVGLRRVLASDGTGHSCSPCRGGVIFTVQELLTDLLKLWGELRGDQWLYATRPPVFELAGVQRCTHVLPSGRPIDLPSGEIPSDAQRLAYSQMTARKLCSCQDEFLGRFSQARPPLVCFGFFLSLLKAGFHGFFSW